MRDSSHPHNTHLDNIQIRYTASQLPLGFDSSDIWWGGMGLRMREKERYEKEALEHLVSMG